MNFMNKLQKMNIVWGIIVVIIFILLTVFGFSYKNKVKAYKELENKLVEAEKKYIDAHFLYPASNEELKTLSSTLIEEGYLDGLIINDETCDGYVIVSHESTVFEYKGYVSCSKYQTKGYKKE